MAENASAQVCLVVAVGRPANFEKPLIFPCDSPDFSQGTSKALAGSNLLQCLFETDCVKRILVIEDIQRSITLHDSDGLQVANATNRFAVSSWMPFKRDADGSLTLYFQNENPGSDLEGNWLPAPKGLFNLTMRLYAPKSEALIGLWNPPPVTMTQDRSSTGAK